MPLPQQPFLCCGDWHMPAYIFINREACCPWGGFWSFPIYLSPLPLLLFVLSQYTSLFPFVSCFCSFFYCIPISPVSSHCLALFRINFYLLLFPLIAPYCFLFFGILSQFLPLPFLTAHCLLIFLNSLLILCCLSLFSIALHYFALPLIISTCLLPLLSIALWIHSCLLTFLSLLLYYSVTLRLFLLYPRCLISFYCVVKSCAFGSCCVMYIFMFILVIPIGFDMFVS